MNKKCINSKQKGKVGELEWAKFLRSEGFKAYRGVQYCGVEGAPDVISDLDNIHWEVKRTETLALFKALKQAIKDASDTKIPVVAHRRNREDWVVILKAKDFLDIMRSFMGFIKDSNLA